MMMQYMYIMYVATFVHEMKMNCSMQLIFSGMFSYLHVFPFFLSRWFLVGTLHAQGSPMRVSVCVCMLSRKLHL